MLLTKTGYPEENELVLCTVTKIHFHSVFVNIDEFGKSGMIHISEISPGRIRNLRDFVVEGKVIVCKVLRIDRVKGHIDLSLRRVTESQKRAKIDEIKQEQKAEKIVEFVAKKLNKDAKSFYDEIFPEISKKYSLLSSCFEDVALNDLGLEKMGIDKKVSALLTEIIKQRIKPPEVEIKCNLTLKSYASDGVEVVKEGLRKAKAKATETTIIKYVGGGKFSTLIKAPDYKEGEKILEKMTNAVSKYMEKQDGEFSFVRID